MFFKKFCIATRTIQKTACFFTSGFFTHKKSGVLSLAGTPLFV